MREQEAAEAAAVASSANYQGFEESLAQSERRGKAREQAEAARSPSREPAEAQTEIAASSKALAAQKHGEAFARERCTGWSACPTPSPPGRSSDRPKPVDGTPTPPLSSNVAKRRRMIAQPNSEDELLGKVGNGDSGLELSSSPSGSP